MLQLDGFHRHVVVYYRVPHGQESVPFVGDGVSFVKRSPVCLQKTQAEGVPIDAPRRPHGDGFRDVPRPNVGDECGDQIVITDVAGCDACTRCQVKPVGDQVINE